jgi:peroxiredoxin family protein
MAINWNSSKSETEKIHKIMLRAASLMSFELVGASRLSVSMDLTACHLNGCALDLDGLLTADKGDLVHDVGGIMHHINRKTGQLENFFCPRYAATSNVKVAN